MKKEKTDSFLRFAAMSFSFRIIVLMLFIQLPAGIISTCAQETRKIELLNADVSEFDQTINARATRLLGNVQFRHENVNMYCDSAYLYREDNRLEAFNNIRITQGDSITLTGKRLIYEGNTRVAQVFEEVVLRDRKMTLYTDQLDYQMEEEMASYTQGAKILDGENTLTSIFGYYYSRLNDFYFREDVLLTNPKYTMDCDTLKYNSVSETAWFLGPTWIRSAENIIYCEDGWYNTQEQTSFFRKNSYLQTDGQKLRGDSVLYNRNIGIGMVFGNVSIYDSTNKIEISGDYGEHHELSDSSWITGNALLSQYYPDDTMSLHADTLLAVGYYDSPYSTQIKRNMFAFHHVKLFKPDLQGICDSLVWYRPDSTIRLFGDPVLWSGANQLIADSVSIQTSNNEISIMYLVNNALIVSKVDSLDIAVIDSIRFNQIRGKNMTGYFRENKMYRIEVEGNGQTIYYAKDKKNKNFSVNRADCSDMVILVDENTVKSITLLKAPDGTLYPIRDLATWELRLKGFRWNEARRPLTKRDIFLRSD
jgi:lipopolysaccharide export system protein LptA